jgi:hypothetical protein
MNPLCCNAPRLPPTHTHTHALTLALHCVRIFNTHTLNTTTTTTTTTTCAAYVQRRLSGGGIPPTGEQQLTQAVLQISPSFSGDGDAPTSVPLRIDPVLGSGHAVLRVPADAPPAVYSLSAYAAEASATAAVEPDSPPTSVPDGVVPPLLPGPPPAVAAPAAGGDFLASSTFTVADPRPPTADLQLTSPPWAVLNASVPVTVETQSYVGGSVAGAVVTLEWSTPRASGSIALTTNASGA